MNAPPARRRMLRAVVQVVGVLAGLASLGWCISMALRPENRGQLERLLNAPGRLILAMFALSLATLVINALLFGAMLAPVRRLRIADLIATNGVCQLVSYLPLKLGAVTRVLIHNRRDHVPLATIGAWFAAMLVPMAVAYGPPMLATIWVREIGVRWFVAVGAAVTAGSMAVVFGAMVFRGHSGLDRMARVAGAIPLLPLGRVLRTRLWGNLHAGFDMLASPWAVAGSAALRLVDMGVHTARFVVAAMILGVDLPLSQALPISVAYFLVGIVSPSGLAGLREGAATGLAAGLLLAQAGATRETAQVFAAVTLLVTATEAVVFVSSGVAGLAWLRADRLLRVRGRERAEVRGAAEPGVLREAAEPASARSET